MYVTVWENNVEGETYPTRENFVPEKLEFRVKYYFKIKGAPIHHSAYRISFYQLVCCYIGVGKSNSSFSAF